MQNNTRKWRADHGARALKTVADIEGSIVSLDDEDLLDLHDIFIGMPTGALATFASAELRRRNLEP